jgi:ubiquinone/menaquinone biosynthesis C-methylase UbiE
MDPWKYYDITHRRHVLCNPTSLAKLDDVMSLLELKQGDRVVDIACGKGEFLARLAERYGVSVVGVDKSAYCIADARKKLHERAPGSDAGLLVMDGADFRADPPESFALASCIGASWVFKGHRGTLRALKGMTAPGGYLLVGEIFWLKEPDPEYLKSDGLTRDFCDSHFENVKAGEEEGLVPLYSAVSSGDDWDRYETLQWHAAAEWTAANPYDPDLPEVLGKQAHAREVYLRWQRDTLGWALYLFKKP